MAKWLLVTETNCNHAAGEEELGRWYDQVHFPDILETPAIISATRYEIVAPVTGRGKFMAIYEIEADSIDDVMKVHNANMSRKRAQGRFSPHVSIVSRAVYKQVSHLSR